MDDAVSTTAGGRTAIHDPQPRRRLGSPTRTSVTGTYDRFTIIILAIFAPLTISSTGVLLFGIPRPTLLSIPFTLYILAAIRGRIDREYLIFSIVYIVSFIPGTLLALGSGDVKPAAALQAIAALINFAALATYFERWLVNCPSIKKKRQLELLLIAYAAFVVFEIFFYEVVSQYRYIFYPTSWSDTTGQLLLDREIRLYGGRPTGFFSETSHFARFTALMAAAYMAVTRNSLLSLIVLGLVATLTRSVSVLFALPAIATIFFYIKSERSTSVRLRVRQMGIRLVFIASVSLLALTAIIYSQGDRIMNALELGGGTSTFNSQDGSLNARLLYPLDYAFNRNEAPLLGMGFTPQDQVQDYVLLTQRKTYRFRADQDYTEGISATAVMIVGLGLVGVILFLFGVAASLKIRGIIMLLAFLSANLISSGYNSVVCFVPSALLLSLMVYAMRTRHIVMLSRAG